MFYHLIHDDKFIDIGYQRFEEAFPNENIYILPEKLEKLVYVKLTPLIISTEDETINYILQNYKTNDSVVIHYLSKTKINVIRKLPKNITVIWIGWGKDYYDLIYSKKSQYYLPDTFQWTRNQRDILHQVYDYFMELLNFKRLKILKFSKHINFITTVIDIDYKLIIKRNPSFKPVYFSWNYGNISYFNPNYTLNNSGNNILIGNSADPTNNHIEVLKLLKKINIKDSKIICPLNYGMPNYALTIVKQGKMLFGDNFIPLQEFMPLEKYYKLISTCSVVFMNHLRQQATGNIATLLLMGCRIILQEKNPICCFLRENGFNINTFGEVEKDNSLIFKPLTNKEKEQNIQVCKMLWNDETALERTLNIKHL